MHIAGRVVIGVEEIVVLLVEARVVLEIGLEHEAFEEPGDVGHMPFRRADVRHRLHDRVFRLQLGDQGQRQAPNALIAIDQGIREFSFGR